MCGVAGIVGSTQQVSPTLDRMIDVIRPRGPDSEGRYTEFRNGTQDGLAHTRLSILDLTDAGAQPMLSDQWVLTFNGEIYNHLRLRDQLEVTWRGTSDTETLLAALDVWGIDKTLERIEGMFAFGAIHRPTGMLHLARDRLGIKPLYWHRREDTLAFASNPAAIMAAFDGGWTLDRRGVARALHLGAPYGESTLVEGIHRLPAATHMVYLPGLEPSVRTYWRPQPREGDLEELVVSAIEDRLLSDVPVGVFLSGGVDSTLVVKHASSATALHLDAGYECSYAQRVAAHFDRPFECVTYDGKSATDLLFQYARETGEVSMSAAAPAMVGRATRGAGLKVALSGNGADELFGGYLRIFQPDQPWQIFRQCIPLGADYALVDVEEDIQSFGGISSDFPPGAAARWLELQTYIGSDLNPTLDHGTMMSGVEVRVPYLDHKVVERALMLPLEQVQDRRLQDQHGSGRKAVLKRMLGPELRWAWDRPKMGFSLPGNDPSIESTNPLLRSVLQRGIVTSLDAGRTRYSGRDTIYMRRALLAVEAWMQVWVDSGRVVV